MGSYISNRNACAHTWSLFNDDHCSLSENRTRMSRSNLSRNALVSQNARARPVAQRAAFEAQIPTKVLRQDQSRSSVHHEGCAGKAALSVSRRNVHRAQDEGWSRPDRRSTATALEGISVAQILWLCHDFGVRPHDARTRVPAYTSSAPQEGVETIPRGGDFFMSALARAERAKARTPPLAKGRPGGPAPTLGWALRRQPLRLQLHLARQQ